MSHIAVIDIGKTNAKLALVNSVGLHEIAVITQPNHVVDSPPWPHFDLAGIWVFIQNGLAQFQKQYGIDAISVTTHGASIVLIGQNGEAFPMLDYEYSAVNSLSDNYAQLRADFSQTGSPHLPNGLNIGAQLHWMLTTDPMIRRHLASIVTYPQYWGYLLTGERASDFTSLGCHSDLWNPYARDFATTLDALGLRSCFAPVRPPDEILGEVKPALAQKLGLPAHLPVMVGIHDSNASLYPHLLSQSGSFSVVSSGTWTIAMAINGSKLALDPDRDSLINVNALGHPVPTARFMGGREFDLIQKGRIYAPTKSDEQSVLEKGIFLLPAIEAATGPFQGRMTTWSVTKRSAGEESVALSFYLALMTRTCLDLIGARGPVIVEGPFANNDEYLRMLSALSPDGLLTSASHTGTSIGAAMLCLPQHKQAATAQTYACKDEPALQAYGAAWRLAVESGL